MKNDKRNKLIEKEKDLEKKIKFFEEEKKNKEME